MTINGITVREPAYGGVEIADEPVWAKNTGRVASGKMKGDIVAWKRTITVTWPPLTFQESKTIRDAIKNAGAFFQIKYPDFNADTLETATVYCDHIPRVIDSTNPVYQRHSGVTIQFTEQ